MSPAPGSGSSRARRRLAPWVVYVVVLVLVVPMITFGLNRLSGLMRPAQQAAGSLISGPSLHFGEGYVASEVLRLGAPGTSAPPDAPQVAVGDPIGTAGTGSSTLEVIASSKNGWWVVDRPTGVAPAARVRRLDGAGRVLSEFTAVVGSTLFTPGIEDDLWVDVAAGGGKTEAVLHYGPDGRVLGRYVLPERFFVRQLSVSPKGECYAATEEWLIDPETGEATHLNALLPVAVGEHLEMPPDAVSKVREAAFVGGDGRFYRCEATSSLGPTSPPPAYRVTSVDTSGNEQFVGRLAPGARPYAADASGTVYAAESPGQLWAAGAEGLGDPAGETGRLWVYRLGKMASMLNIPFPPCATNWAPIASVDNDGSLLVVTAEGDGLHAYRLRRQVAAAEQADAEVDGPDAVLISPTEPITGDPYAAADDAQRDAFRLLYSGLVSFDASLEPVPELAEWVPEPGGRGVSRDGKVIEFELRRGVTWHDGTPVTGQDVVATWEFLRRSRVTLRARPFPGFEHIKSVESKGSKVAVEFDEPFAARPESLFPFILPAHLLPTEDVPNAALFEAPVGSGPYRLVKWATGAGWALEAHAGASRGGPRIRRLDVVFRSDVAARAAAAAAPAPALWSRVEPWLVTEVQRDRIGETTSVPTGRWWGWVANTETIPDVGVRRAIALAFPGRLEAEEVLGIGAGTGASPYPAWVAGPVVRPEQADATAAARAMQGQRQDGVVVLTTTVRQGKDEVLSEEIDPAAALVSRSGVKARFAYSRPRYYASWWRGGYLAVGAADVGLGVYPGHPSPGWGGVFDPEDIPRSGNPRGAAVHRLPDPVLTALERDARAADSARLPSIAAAQLRRIQQLGIAYFERPEQRTASIIGDLRGVRPAAYPAGDTWNVREWRIGGSE